MNNIKNKTLAIVITVILTISMAASMTLLSNVSAHNTATDKSTWNIPTYAYIVAEPNPIGVGQTIEFYMWLDIEYGSSGGTTAAIGSNGSTASAALLSNNYRFEGYQYSITTPSGKTTTTTFTTTADPTSDQYVIFTPTEVGTYTLTFYYPGQVYGAKDALYPNGNGYEKSTIYGDYYMPSNATTTLTVQEDPIPSATGSSPLPTAFWTRPIYGENTNWYTITSNWLGSGSAGSSNNVATSNMHVFHPDGAGSLTSHIMWTKPLQDGGVVGGIFGTDSVQTATLDPANLGVSYGDGSAYEPRFQNPIIVDGFLYYREPIGYTAPNNGPLDCVNLVTGQLVWSKPDLPPISFAYVYNLWDQDEHGTFDPILFTSNFAQAFDAYTGDTLFNVTNVPTGTAAVGPEGEQLKYVMTNTAATGQPQTWYLQEWNSSKLWQYDINPFNGAGSCPPSIINASNGAVIVGQVGTNFPVPAYQYPNGQSVIINANVPINGLSAAIPGYTYQLNSTLYPSLTTYDWNISIPWHNGQTPTASIIEAKYGDRMLLRNGSLSSGYAATNTGTSQGPWTYFVVDLNTTHSTFGQVLWSKTYNPPAGNLSLSQGGVDFDTNVFVLTSSELVNWYGYSLKDGSLLWTTPSQPPFDYYGNEGTVILPGQIAYGTLYCSSFSGILYAYNLTTGQIEFTFGNGPQGSNNSTKSGLDTFYGDYPTMIQAISNGVIYEVTAEHTVTDPIYKGAMSRAINATTGEQIWTLNTYLNEFGSSGYALADGYNVWINSYDMQLYTVGRGPSSLTMQAPLTGVTAGNSVVIQGTVTDISTGTKQTEQALDFPKGVPVAADSIMGSWMSYIYQQQPLPTNFVGVPVTLTAIDPNGNYITLGTATTTNTGLFTYTWTPPNIPGSYLVTATFAGTNSYWPSNAQTGMAVMSMAPTPTPALTAAQSTADMYFVPAVAAIIIVIVIGFAVLSILMLRQRP